MSELHIALVVEGNTDLVIIEAALNAFIDRPFILSIQPEETSPTLGSGWSGVLKWCDASGRRHPSDLDSDPTLKQFDLLIIHLDVDVATEHYANASLEQLAAEKHWSTLPCAQPCPPIDASIEPLIATLDSWLQPANRGNRTVLCLPAQASGTWLAAATLPGDHPLLSSAQCDVNVESRLAQLPIGRRIHKKVREYRSHSHKITQNWAAVKAICSQAQVFETEVLNALRP